jgi:stearoyl-CoA desaturase (delta-9 desaturase)
MSTVRVFYVIGCVSLLFLLIYTVATLNVTWLLASLIYYYFIGIVGLSIGYHRYFSHRSFETDDVRKCILLFTNLLSGQGSLLVQASIHRHHHAFSDTERDVHSSKESLFDQFFFFLKNENYFIKEKRIRVAGDLLKDRHVVFFHKHYLKIWLLIVGVSMLINVKILFLLIFPAIGLAFLHTNFIRTFISHRKLSRSYRNFETKDLSYNTMKWQYFSLGEGLHNNHHANPSSGNQAVYQSEFDPVWYIIKKFFLRVDNK